jgi:hypothetical protein
VKDTDLAKLRRAHFALKQAETLAQGNRDKPGDLEIRIYTIAPELDLPAQTPAQTRCPNQIFARGELTRFALDMLREAGRPLAVREIALAALAAKGVRFPDRRIMKATRVRLREAFGAFEARRLTRTVGAGKATVRALA